MKPFRERNPVVIGAVSILVMTLALLAAFRAQDLPLIGGGDTYYAKFTEAGGLRANDEVRIAGVRVGKVEEVKLDGSEVRVKFRIQGDSPFGTDTGAAIKVKTLLGSMFLALEPAGKGQLEEGTTIPTSRTSSPFDVVEAFTGLAETTSEIDTDQMARSMTVMADLSRNTPEEFRDALDGVARLSGNLADRDQEIGRLLTSLRRISNVLDERDEDIIGLMRDSDVLFRAIVERRDQIHALLVSTSTLSRELTTLVRESRADLTPALEHLDNVLQVLNKNEDNLNDSIRLMEPFYRVFANTLGSGPWFDTFIYNFPNQLPNPVTGGVG